MFAPQVEKGKSTKSPAVARKKSYMSFREPNTVFISQHSSTIDNTEFGKVASVIETLRAHDRTSSDVRLDGGTSSEEDPALADARIGEVRRVFDTMVPGPGDSEDFPVPSVTGGEIWGPDNRRVEMSLSRSAGADRGISGQDELIKEQAS